MPATSYAQRMELFRKQNEHNDAVGRRYQEIQAMKSPELSAEIAKIRQSSPSVWQWLQTLEMQNTRIWCDTCMASCNEHELKEFPPSGGMQKRSKYAWQPIC